MNLEIKTIPSKLLPVAQKVTKYLGLILFLVFVAIYAFLVIRVNSLIAAKPTESAITEKLKTVQRPRIDEKAAAKMQQLEDQNVNVQALFNDARQNPFTE